MTLASQLPAPESSDSPSVQAGTRAELVVDLGKVIVEARHDENDRQHALVETEK